MFSYNLSGTYTPLHIMHTADNLYIIRLMRLWPCNYYGLPRSSKIMDHSGFRSSYRFPL